MSSLLETRLKCNSNIKINFDGSGLSSDTGMFLIKEFVHKIGFDKVIKNASRIVRTARYITFKLCSSYPYKTKFYETLENIRF